MKKRKFTKEQKLQIIKEATEQGVNTTLEKHGIYPATYYSWKKKFETMGEAGFRHGMTPAQLKEIKHGKQRFISLVSLSSMIVVITLNIVLPKYYGHLSIAFAFCIGYFIRLVAVFIMAQKTLPLPWFKALKIWK